VQCVAVCCSVLQCCVSIFSKNRALLSKVCKASIELTQGRDLRVSLLSLLKCLKSRLDIRFCSVNLGAHELLSDCSLTLTHTHTHTHAHIHAHAHTHTHTHAHTHTHTHMHTHKQTHGHAHKHTHTHTHTHAHHTTRYYYLYQIWALSFSLAAFCMTTRWSANDVLNMVFDIGLWGYFIW